MDWKQRMDWLLVEASCWVQTVHTSTLRSYVSFVLPVTPCAECVFLFSLGVRIYDTAEFCIPALLFFINSRCAVSVFVVRQINRPFPAIRVRFYRGKNKSSLVLRVGKCCRCALLNVAQNSSPKNCTEAPLNPCLLRVSSSREPEYGSALSEDRANQIHRLSLCVCKPRHVNSTKFLR